MRFMTSSFYFTQNREKCDKSIKNYPKKSRIQETPNRQTDADRKKQFFFVEKKKNKNLIRSKSLFLGLYELLHKCTSPPVEHLPRVDHQRVQSGTTPCFKGSTSRSTSAPVHQLNTSHAWTIHVCNSEQLLVLGLYKLVNECTSPPVEHLPCVDNS